MGVFKTELGKNNARCLSLEAGRASRGDGMHRIMDVYIYILILICGTFFTDPGLSPRRCNPGVHCFKKIYTYSYIYTCIDRYMHAYMHVHSQCLQMDIHTHNIYRERERERRIRTNAPRSPSSTSKTNRICIKH